MAPKRVARQAKAKAKREAQERLRVRLDYKTKRMLNRRRAVQGMNVLLSGLSLSELALNPKDTDMNGLGRALRVLEKRCTARGALRSAVQAWVSNGGKLPAGIRLTILTWFHASLNQAGMKRRLEFDLLLASIWLCI